MNLKSAKYVFLEFLRNIDFIRTIIISIKNEMIYDLLGKCKILLVITNYYTAFFSLILFADKANFINNT